MNDIRKILESIDNIDPKTDIGDVFLGSLWGDPEKDTPVEAQIKTAVARYISSPRPEHKEKLYNILKQLHNFKHLYPNELITDTRGSYVYRGTMIDKEIIAPIEQKARYNNINPYARYFPYTYNPLYSIQSWTTNILVAADFGAGKSYKTKPYTDERSPRKLTGFVGLVLRIIPDDSFILSVPVMRKLGYSHEYEVIRASKEPLKCEASMVSSFDHFIGTHFD